MTFSKYIKKTFRRGSFFVKFVKLYRLYLHTLFYFRGKKIGNYPSPPKEFDYAGYFDKNFLVHPENGYDLYFADENIYKNGDYVKMKPGAISLVLIGSRILVRKVFKGTQKYNKFYNELICLHKLLDINNVPNIRFVNYSNCEIFMDYIDGLNLARIRKEFKGEINQENFYEIESLTNELVKEVHESGVIMYDLKDSNMMRKNKEFYLFDFADAMYFGQYLSRYIQFLEHKEIHKVRYELLQLLENCAFKNELVSTYDNTQLEKNFKSNRHIRQNK